jgi:hypothetical protein
MAKATLPLRIMSRISNVLLTPDQLQQHGPFAKCGTAATCLKVACHGRIFAFDN